MNPLWLIPIAGAVLGLLRKKSDGSVATSPLQLTGKWVDSDGPRRIRLLARPIEQAMHWPGLADYLAAISWVESRGSSQSGSDAQNNLARGWFGMRPESALLEELGMPHSALKSEPEAVALAAWYAYRCLKYADPGQVVDWLAIRRCWGYPSRTDDVGTDSGFASLSDGLEHVGLPQSFMYRPAFPSGFQWLGIHTALQLARSAS